MDFTFDQDDNQDNDFLAFIYFLLTPQNTTLLTDAGRPIPYPIAKHKQKYFRTLSCW